MLWKKTLRHVSEISCLVMVHHSIPIAPFRSEYCNLTTCGSCDALCPQVKSNRIKRSVLNSFMSSLYRLYDCVTAEILLLTDESCQVTIKTNVVRREISLLTTLTNNTNKCIHYIHNIDL